MGRRKSQRRKGTNEIKSEHVFRTMYIEGLKNKTREA